ncbi:PilW family protein [Psychromonas sp. PT13]|uniref:PilW family protein n=1 Tax=Psychromonas sp. PT13 TaxID=3439547 RepID=UPI003EB95540
MGSNIKNKLNLRYQDGFTLIELMIAIPLGLLVMFAVLQIFTANVQGLNTQNAFSRVQESGRMSTEILTRDIRSADFWGCIHDTSLIKNLEGNASVVVPTGQQGVLGVENYTSATQIGGISVKSGTDTLTLRGSTGFPDAKIAAAMVSASAGISFTAGSGIATGDVLLIVDCEGADTLTNTSIVDGTISHASALSNTYGIDAQVLIPYIKIYFIGINGEGTNSLYISENGSVTELVRGVNDLQLLYGEDTTNDGSADTVSNADGVTVMGNVLFVRVQLVSDSGSDTSAVSLQRTHTVTVNIRNRTL